MNDFSFINNFNNINFANNKAGLVNFSNETKANNVAAKNNPLNNSQNPNLAPNSNTNSNQSRDINLNPLYTLDYSKIKMDNELILKYLQSLLKLPNTIDELVYQI